MTPQEFQKKLLEAVPAFKQYAASEFPRKVAKMGVDHFKDNFRKGGFVDNGLKMWPRSKRETNPEGKGADANYKTLLSARNELFNSITGNTRGSSAVIKSDKEYAEIHNEGGTINHPGGTAYFAKNNNAVFVSNETADRYQSLYLKPMPRTGPHAIPIPKRQFIGPSRELNDKINAEVERKLRELL